MPDLDDELSELQRRAYGPGGEELGADQRARLAVLEAARRMPPPMESEPIPPRPPLPAAAVGAVPADPIGPKPEESLPATDRGAARLWWFTPALVAAIGVGAVIAMLVAGGMGWGGGYVAGVARNAWPGGRAELAAELHPTAVPERVIESGAGFYFMNNNAETGEVAEDVTYFGALDGDIDVLTVRPNSVDQDALGAPADTVCLQVTQFLKEEEGGMLRYANGLACGSPALDVSVDLFVGAEDGASTGGLRLGTHAFPEDTLLRFTYSASADVVTVWSLAPGE